MAKRGGVAAATVMLSVLGLAVPAAGRDARDLYAALESGNTDGVTSFVTEYYRDAGISTNEGLTWQLQGFDKIVNWYNDFNESILLAELPAPDEVPVYWQNWSEVLTDGRWDWRTFFASPEEAWLLANFNQFLLAAHEYGHALTYRYDPDYDQRWDQEINCREYAADRLETVLLQEVARADPRIAALKARYQALIAELNGLIAPADRYEGVTYAELTADCRVMHVVQPTETTMTPYASAFFMRQQLLQAADLPTLGEVYATELVPHWRARQLPPAGLASAVTSAPIDIAFDMRRRGLEGEGRVPAFAADGSLYVLEYGFDGEDHMEARFGFGPAGGPVAEIFPLQTVPGVKTTGDLTYIGSAVVLGPDHVVALQNGLGWDGDEGLLFDLRRGADGTWALRTLDVAGGDYIELWVSPDARGSIHVSVAPAGGDTNLRVLTIDPETLAITASTDYPTFYGTAIATGADGVTYYWDDNAIRVAGADGTPRALAGSGLQGFKDAAEPLAAEFISAGYGIALPGRLVVIDQNPVTRDWVLRSIALED